LSASVIDFSSATDEALIAFMQSSCDALVIQCPISDRVEVDFYD